MRVVILGSGLVGLLAKEMFSEATIIPFGRSRFYYYAPPLADDFIICSQKIDDFVKSSVRPHSPIPTLMNRKFSMAGVLTKDASIMERYLDKVYIQYPSFASELIKTEFFIYPIRCGVLYRNLLNKRKAEIHNELKLGKVISIEPGVIRLEKGAVEYDLLISTIPLDILINLTSANFAVLRSHNVQYFHIRTGDLGFEGADQVLVADQFISFHRVDRMSSEDYLFHVLGKIENPSAFFGVFLKKFNIVASVEVKAAISSAPYAPDLSDLRTKFKIEAVGSMAQWDHFLDVSSAILRLLRLSGK